MYVPTVFELTVRSEETDPPGPRLTVPGLVAAVRPAGVTDAERVIVPVKPATLLSVMDEVPELPTRVFTVVGLAETVKSPTPTVIVVAWDRGPLAAVTVTV